MNDNKIVYLKSGTRISFVILSWNSGKYLRNCLNSASSFCSNENIPCEFIVIDNGSQDNSISILKNYSEKYPQLFKVLYLGVNKGTTYSRNLAIRKANGQYICILDSDTEFIRGSLEPIIALLHQHPEVGIIAPKLILENDKIQISVKKFPTFWIKMLNLSKIIFQIHIKNLESYEDFPFKTIWAVDSAISACWFFRKDLIGQVGFFDEKIYYSPEDLDFCMRVRKAGKQILYYPYLEVRHYTQQVTHKKPLSSLSFSHFFGLLYYFHKHGCWISNKKSSHPYQP